MARIVYGVSGEGSGHSSRARAVLEHLIESGHAVKVVTYGRGVRHLAPDFDIFETIGLHIASVNNRVSPLKTLLTNLQQLPDGHRTLNALREDIFKSFAPEVVITDFEPMCAYLAYHYDLPLITIDNQHRLRYMYYDYPPRLKNDRNLAVAVIRAMVPKPDLSLITTFSFGKLKNQRAFLFPRRLFIPFAGIRRCFVRPIDIRQFAAVDPIRCPPGKRCEIGRTLSSQPQGVGQAS